MPYLLTEEQDEVVATVLPTLWEMYEATQAQVALVQAEKVATLARMTALRVAGTADVSSVSQSGEAGSESYTLISLQTRYDSLVKTEIDLTKMMYEQRLHAIKGEAGFIVSRHGHQHFRQYH